MLTAFDTRHPVEDLAGVVSSFMGDELALVRLLDGRREELGINWVNVADSIGTAESTVSRWRQGVVPSQTYRPGIARFLGITVEDVNAMLPDVPHPLSRAAGRGLEDKVDELTRLLGEIKDRVAESEGDGRAAASALDRLAQRVESFDETMLRLVDALEQNAQARRSLEASAPAPRQVSPRTRRPKPQSH